MPSHPFSKLVQICGQAQSAEISEGVANERECTRLRLLPDERVYRIRRIRDRWGRAFLVEDVTLPAALFPALADKRTVADHIGTLAQEYLLRTQPRARNASNITKPRPEEASLMTFSETWPKA